MHHFRCDQNAAPARRDPIRPAASAAAEAQLVVFPRRARLTFEVISGLPPGRHV